MVTIKISDAGCTKNSKKQGRRRAEMKETRSKKDYGGKALIAIFVCLGLYLGCGTYFSIKGVESPVRIRWTSIVREPVRPE